MGDALINLLHHGFRQALGADGDNGLEMMGKPLEVFTLFDGECGHGGGLYCNTVCLI